MIQLRPDQAELQAAIYDGWRRGMRNGVAVLPTGGGKSVIISDTVRQHADGGASTLVMAHRRELVGQMSLHIARQGVRHRIIAPKDVVASIRADHRAELGGNCYVVPDASVAVGGVDTIMSRRDDMAMRDYLARLDLLVCDEGHHALQGNKWGNVFDLCGRARGLLVTATPQRADGKGLGRHADGVIDFMAQGPSMRWLIDHGALSEYEIICPKSDFDVDHLATGSDGDFTNASMRAASERSRIVGDVVETYCKHAWGKRGVCFATDVATAKRMADQFVAWGIPAMAISGATDSHVRDDAIRRLRDGRLWMLVNVDLLGEGFDLPAIEVVIMARPTNSLAVYMQQFGRALRMLAGKAFGLVIDHVSNVVRHRLPDMPRRWTLDRRDKRKARERDPELVGIVICSGCSKPYEAIHHSCPYCGHIETPPGERAGRSEIEVVKGDLTRLDVETLRRLREAADLPDPDAMAARAAYAGHGAGAAAGQRNIAFARIEAQRELGDAVALWAGYQRSKGRDDSDIHRRFYATTGVDVLTAMSGTRADMLSLAETVKGWIK